jgi:hypothetical protein
MTTANGIPHGVLLKNPENNNLLNPLNFVLRIQRAPSTNWFIQKLNMPGVQLRPVKQPTPFSDIWQPGDHLTYSPLKIQFRVDEDLQNYFELLNWITALGLPDNFEDYAALAKQPEWSNLGVFSEIVLSILDSARNDIYNVYFHDSFPIDLTDMNFDLTPQGINYQVASATFRYTSYDFEKVYKPPTE